MTSAIAPAELPGKVIALTSGRSKTIAPLQPDAAKHFRYRQIEQFLQARAFAENTCRNYRRQLRAFICEPSLTGWAKTGAVWS